MILPDKLSFTVALAVGAIAAMAFLIAQFHATTAPSRAGALPGKVVAAGQTATVQSIEGGVQPSGYIDGRPVPSGFSMPVVIRYHSSEPDVTGAITPPIGKAPPVEAGAIDP